MGVAPFGAVREGVRRNDLARVTHFWPWPFSGVATEAILLVEVDGPLTPKGAAMRHGKALSIRARVLASIGAVGATAAVAGLGTFGTFTSTTTAQTPTYASGTVVLDFGATGTTNELSVGASGMAAGDYAQRMFTLRNSGTLNMGSVKLNIAATTSSALDTDSANGLNIKIDKCTAGWVRTGTATPYTYTCADVGGATNVLASTPVATVKTTPATVSSLSALTAAGSDSLLATFTVPSAASNAVQGQSSTLSMTFVGTQASAGAAK